MTAGVLTQGQTMTMILMVAVEMEAAVTTDLMAEVARKVMEAKALATAVTMTNPTKVSLAAHQD